MLLHQIQLVSIPDLWRIQFDFESNKNYRLGLGNGESHWLNCFKHQVKLNDRGLCEKLEIFRKNHTRKVWSSIDELIGSFIEEMKNIDCAAYNYHNQCFDHFWCASQQR